MRYEENKIINQESLVQEEENDNRNSANQLLSLDLWYSRGEILSQSYSTVDGSLLNFLQDKSFFIVISVQSRFSPSPKKYFLQP
jgi:hypothetical protein